MDNEAIDWLRSNFLPFEAELRVMLRRVCNGPADIDDVIQETYYHVMQMTDVSRINDPKGFLVRTAKNIIIDRFRREAIVSIESMANLEDLDVADPAPCPEQVAMARAELRWVIGLIANLPHRCKEVFRARRIYGMSQAETAATLGVSEGIVEQESMRGMKLISKMIASVGAPESPKRVAAPKFNLARKRNHVND